MDVQDQILSVCHPKKVWILCYCVVPTKRYHLYFFVIILDGVFHKCCPWAMTNTYSTLEDHVRIWYIFWDWQRRDESSPESVLYSPSCWRYHAVRIYKCQLWGNVTILSVYRLCSPLKKDCICILVDIQYHLICEPYPLVQDCVITVSQMYRIVPLTWKPCTNKSFTLTRHDHHWSMDHSGVPFVGHLLVMISLTTILQELFS